MARALTAILFVLAVVLVAAQPSAQSGPAFRAGDERRLCDRWASIFSGNDDGGRALLYSQGLVTRQVLDDLQRARPVIGVFEGRPDQAAYARTAAIIAAELNLPFAPAPEPRIFRMDGLDCIHLYLPSRNVVRVGGADLVPLPSGEVVWVFERSLPGEHLAAIALWRSAAGDSQNSRRVAAALTAALTSTGDDALRVRAALGQAYRCETPEGACMLDEFRSVGESCSCSRRISGASGGRGATPPVVVYSGQVAPQE